MTLKLTPSRLGTMWKMIDRILVIECEKVPKIGSKIYDKSLREVGVVVNVFGPVSQPFAEVRLTNPSKYVFGEVFYIMEKIKK
ncbi:MAG: H/ACA RNA-protein complex component Gar1 [Aigarchaeota archaeon]|nr:H/ACA RNA-protein complex component Gar1 [Aigarchaeota archaeon]MCX8193384.1 H/ACA RNA-protein complex component Gar1 [Nitrososphaeria archaeon]MDW7985914.1 H/ACA RNA-protein complex component Gar1 [Nitrososphaerota archaeon]